MIDVGKMKVVIFAGGLGTRLSEETATRPKPMVEIGGRPLLWHIMKIYSSHGFRNFIICLGYKGYVIKEFFRNYYLHTADVTFDIAKNDFEVHRTEAEHWRVTLAETGDTTMTGGRLKRVAEYLGDEDFCLTYGDGVADIDFGALLATHAAHGRLATVTAVRPQPRFGALVMEDGLVKRFEEKPLTEGGWVNGGFFVLSPKVIERIEGDATIWERAPLESLARDDQLGVYKHGGFWAAVDTLRDKTQLEEYWASGKAPWKIW